MPAHGAPGHVTPAAGHVRGGAARAACTPGRPAAGAAPPAGAEDG